LASRLLPVAIHRVAITHTLATDQKDKTMSNVATRKENNGNVACIQNEWELTPPDARDAVLGPVPRDVAVLSERGACGWLRPGVSVKDTKESFIFKADLPGVKQTDIDISCIGNRLNVQAEREEKTDTYYACERSYGSFHRGFTLPAGPTWTTSRPS
jgi:HSP20 family protein